MLIEFSVSNHRSLRDRQTLSLVVAKGNELMDSNTFETDTHRPIRLLKSAAIYGPNASGKTNLLDALYTMYDIVLESASDHQPGDKLPVYPFQLDRTKSEIPCEFEVIIVVDAVRYQYGFTASADRICDEWLYAHPKGRPQCWFERTWNEAAKQYHWKLGNNLSGEKRLWKKLTRENALFLSTAVQLNSKQLQPVFDWFKNKLHIIGIRDMPPNYSASLCKEEKKDQILKFLKKADLSIDEILVEVTFFDSDVLLNELPRSVRDKISDELENRALSNIKMVHKSAEGEKVEFDFEEESRGTQKLFAFSGPWIESLANGDVLFVDELHGNLHPALVRFLVQLFHSKKSNPNNAQLVFTTHETSILNQDIFRRDQIWFFEKDTQQASDLYPLTDFSPRKGRENLELAYLSGRYGAVPFIESSAM